MAAADHRDQWRRAGPGLGLEVERALVGPARRRPPRSPLVLSMAVELTTVADDVAVVHDGVEVRRVRRARARHRLRRSTVSRSARCRVPPGELLCRFATVNDVHFGETECGRLDETQPELGPVLAVADGRAALPRDDESRRGRRDRRHRADAVVVKGDLTAWGTRRASTPTSSTATARPSATGCTTSAATTTPWPARPTPTDRSAVDLPGVTLAVLDTVVPGSDSGTVDADQLAWLDDLVARPPASR